MKGIGKALARTPFAVTSKIGMAKKSSDPEFDELHRHFQLIESGTEKLIKDTKAFTDAVISLFTSGAGFATHYAVIFQPIAGEYDLIGKHPDAGHTIRHVLSYQEAMEELQQLISPELELIETRIQGPVKELQGIVKTIRKTITKRDHKLTDYDRHNNSLTKLRDKKEKSLSDEKHLFKLEQDFEIATSEYEYINTALKQDLPRFLQLATAFIDPLFNSLFYMQLNIYYLLLEKMQSFADSAKYDVTNSSGAEIQHDYEMKRTDAWERLEGLAIIKRIVSVSRMVQQNRLNSGASGTGSLGRSSTMGSSSSYGSKVAPPPSRTPSSAAAYKKAPPPPPPGSYGASHAPPPPYSPAGGSSSAGNRLQMPSPALGRSPSSASSIAATKRPPPPPPLKPKPKPVVTYVTAIYDFEAQADGDLSFRAGDRIELVKKTPSQEDWWTGRVNGQEGIFPGNYVQEQ